MLLVLDTLTGECSPTKTYARRQWVYVPEDRGAPGWTGAYAHVTIVMQKTGGGFAKAETFKYLVEEQVEHGRAGRLFILVKRGPENPDGELYECFVADDERLSSCTCTAGQCRVDNCKHRDCIRDIIANGGF